MRLNVPQCMDGFVLAIGNVLGQTFVHEILVPQKLIKPFKLISFHAAGMQGVKHSYRFLTFSRHLDRKLPQGASTEIKNKSVSAFQRGDCIFLGDCGMTISGACANLQTSLGSSRLPAPGSAYINTLGEPVVV